MIIVNAELRDVDQIFDLYAQAIEFQKTRFDKHWLGFDVSLIETEIREQRLWKIIEDEQIACIFSTALTDPLVWGEKSGDPALYLHRIVTNPQFRGRRGYVKIIVGWAEEYARSFGKKYLRMDTWGDNQKLIDYYIACGFNFLGLTTPSATENLPKHYQGISLSLFEIELDNLDKIGDS